MAEKYGQPHWALLFLVLPLAGVMLWLVQGARVSGAGHNLLDVGVLLVVAGYVELWRFANVVALLHHPLTGAGGSPIDYVRGAAAADTSQSKSGVTIPATGGFYSDLFSLPVKVAEQSLSSADTAAGRQEIG